jgi:hypothetical protein
MTYRRERQFILPITDAGKLHKQSFQLEKNAKAIKGISVSSDFPDYLYYRGSLGLFVNQQEVFQEGYDAKKLVFSTATGMNDRLAKVDVPVGDGQVEVKFQDSEHPRTDFSTLPAGYRFILFLDIEYEN